MAKDVYASIQKDLVGRKVSLRSKYAEIFVGRRGLGAFLAYELLTFVSGLPGALGYALRKSLFRRLLKSVGPGCVFGRNVTIRHPKKIVVGANTFVDDNAVLDAKGEENEGIVIGANAYVGRNAILSCKEGSIYVGDYGNISSNCQLLSETEIRLGNYTFLAGNCYLVAGGNHGFDDLETPIMFQPSAAKGGIRVEENCWLGAGVIVLDGVTIGKGSIVGAGSVVPASLPEFSFARGARMLKIEDRRQR